MNKWRSTSTTTINSTLTQSTYGYNKKKVGIQFFNGLHNYTLRNKFSNNEQNLMDFISSQQKVFVNTSSSFYHFYHDDLAEFYLQYKKTPDAKFIVDITHIADLDPLPSHVKLFFNFLNNNKVDYVPIDFRKVDKFNINNYYYRRPDSESPSINNPAVEIREFSKNFVNDLTKSATKKVYLSRKNFRSRDLSLIIKGRLPYENDDRIDDEKKLEDYFSSLGFEIIVPEDFKNMEEQINYFYEVKTLVSLTGSGITNSCFMQENSKVIEITTPLISFSGLVGNGVIGELPQGQQEIHHFYHGMSLRLNNKYMSIPNENRKSEEIIKIIENDKLLKEWMRY